MKKVDLTGKRFGKLVVIERIEPIIYKDKKIAQYKVKCDCGVEKNIRHGNLQSGHATSCGCFGRQRAKEASQLPKGQAAFNLYYGKYKNESGRRDLTFALSEKSFKDIIKKDCVYCGTAPKILKSAAYSTCNGSIKANGIDRVDNDIGYLPSNCVPCCTKCNMMKHKLDEEDFVNHCQLISDFQSGHFRNFN